MILEIENWSVVHLDPYQAPENSHAHLHGDVKGHPSLGDVKGITTSRIVSVDNRTVVTKNGTVYTLGNICPEYLKWCEETEGVRVPKENDWIRIIHV